MAVRIFLNLAQYNSQLASVNFLTDVDTVVTAADMLTFANKKGISSVPGASSDSEAIYNGIIECLHYEHQLGQNVANFPTAGIAVHNTFYLQKFIDKSSATLANYCHYALPLLYAIIYVINDASPRVRTVTYILTGVNVARIRHSDAHASDQTFGTTSTTNASTGVTTTTQTTINQDGLPRESIHLAYRGIVWIAFDAAGLPHTSNADRLWGPNTTTSPNAGI